MNRTRRQFMQVCAAAIGASAGSQPVPGSSSPAAAQDSLTNWAGNYRYSTSRLYQADVPRERIFELAETRSMRSRRGAIGAFSSSS